MIYFLVLKLKKIKSYLKLLDAKLIGTVFYQELTTLPVKKIFSISFPSFPNPVAILYYL